MRKIITAVVVPLLMATSALPSMAAEVYTQSYDGLGNLFASQNATPGANGDFAKVYDNFSLSSTTSITDLHWTGGYFNPASQGTITNFFIQFWADATGPGSPLYSASIGIGAANETLVGIATTGVLIYSYDVDLASAFQATANTTYWLSIQPTMQFPPQWGWATGTGGDGQSYQDFFTTKKSPLAADMAFSLTSTPSNVPEPGSLFLAGLALAGLFGAGRRKRT